MNRWSWDDVVATWGGAGASPFAPGTVGSAAALVAWWALRRVMPFPLRAALGLSVLVAGGRAAGRVAARLGDDDPSRVVVDEVVGQWLALELARPRSVAESLVAFGAFRLFDIVKPFPIRQAERLRPPAIGIMADDVVAGLAAGLLARLLRSATRSA